MTVPTTLQDVPVTLALLSFVVALVIAGAGIGMWISRVKAGASDAARAAEARATAAAMTEVNRLREEAKTESERARSRNSELAQSLDAFKLHVAQTHPTHEHVATALNSVREDIKAMDGRITGQMADFRRDVREMLATIAGRHPPP